MPVVLRWPRDDKKGICIGRDGGGDLWRITVATAWDTGNPRTDMGTSSDTSRTYTCTGALHVAYARPLRSERPGLPVIFTS